MKNYTEYRLGSICSRLSSGKGITAEDIFDEGEYPVYGGNGLRGYTSTKNFTGSCAIIGRQGAYCGNVKYFEGEAYMTEHAVVVVANQEHNTRYLSFVLDGLKLGRLSGQAAQPGLSVKQLAKIRVFMPEKSYQDKIANMLTEYDLAIDNNNKRIKILEQMAENLYKEWFVRFRFPGYKDVEFEGGIPKGWSVVKLEKILRLLDSQRIPLSSMERDAMEQKYPYYGAAGQLGYVEDYIFDGIYLLLGEDGSVITEDGYPYLQYVWGKFWVNNHAHIIEKNNIYSVEFLYCLFKKMNIRAIVTGVAQPKISQGRLMGRKIILPKDELVKKFDDIIQPIFAEIRQLTDANYNLTTQRDLLLPRLMSGKLEVK